MQKRTLIPSNEQYQTVIKDLTDKNLFRTLIAVRLGCEMGMTRLEIVNARLSDLDRYHNRGLWVEIAKKVHRGNKIIDGKKTAQFQARSREIPMNTSLYALVKGFASKSPVYLLYREKGDIMKPLQTRNLNSLYTVAEIPWSTHKSRHYFANRMKDYMREKHQVDEGLLADLLGHKKTQTQQYGSLSWDYKQRVIDEVFR
jgi:integrase